MPGGTCKQFRGCCADVSDGTVNGCTIDTPRFQVQVYQVVSSDQAANFDFEAWAAPFTW